MKHGPAIAPSWDSVLAQRDTDSQRLAVVVAPADPQVTHEEAIRRATRLLTRTHMSGWQPQSLIAAAQLANAWLKLAPHLPHEAQDVTLTRKDTTTA